MSTDVFQALVAGNISTFADLAFCTLSRGQIWVHQPGGSVTRHMDGRATPGTLLPVAHGPVYFDPSVLRGSSDWQGDRLILLAFSVAVAPHMCLNCCAEASALPMWPDRRRLNSVQARPEGSWLRCHRRRFNLAYIHAGLPCGTCSRARERRLPVHLRSTRSAPPPLRDARFVLEIPNITGTLARRVHQANSVYAFTLHILAVAHRRQILVFIASPGLFTHMLECIAFA